MAVESPALLAFNRGIISPLALARTDVKRVQLSAQIQTNWMPRTLGSMMLRPGTQFIDTTLNNAKAIYIPFIFSNTQTAEIEVTDSNLRFRVNEQIVTRAAVATAVTNGTFNGNLNGWTQADQAGATSAWAAGNLMSLTGTLFNSALRKQTVTVAAHDQGVEHALRIVVASGAVTLRVGSADGLDDYVPQKSLRAGTYSLAFTPTGNFYIQVSSLTQYRSLVQSITIEGAGALILPSPFVIGDLGNIRWDQSADVIFAACDGHQQRRISRFTADSRSWGIDLYQPPDGPFRLQNLSTTTLTPSGLSGDITITASSPLFYPSQVGALFSITSVGQVVSASLAGSSQFTNAIKVIGVGAGQRTFTINISGTWVGTLTLQQSVGSPGAWIDVLTFTGNTVQNYNDGLDNQIIYYQLGFKAAAYTSGTAVALLSYNNGSLTGIVRITAYGNATSVSAQVLTPLGAQAVASSNWSEGQWSDYRGWPTSNALFEGRLWWFGRDNISGSVSDAFESFDATVVGDSGPISRSIGSGAVDVINWGLPLLRLVLGGQAAEHSVRSSSLDEPLTPTNFSIKQPSTQGSTGVTGAKMDMSGFFINKGGTRLFTLAIENAYYSYDYQSKDLTLFAPEVGKPGFVRIAIQRMPDTRIHCVRADGQVAILVYDPLEEVQAWILYQTSGVVEDVIIMPNPGQDEDKVYYVVQRNINGQAVRCFERWALETECIGGAINKNIDCHTVYSGAATNIITAAAYLEGQTVVVWGDGKDLGTAVVSNGMFSLPVACSNVVYGIPFTAPYQSSKLAYAAQGGSALTQKKRISYLGVILQNTHYQGLRYGPDFDHLDDLPLVEDGYITPANKVWDSYDKDSFPFDGNWETDSRLCLQAASPRPCTLLAAVLAIETNVKSP